MKKLIMLAVGLITAQTLMAQLQSPKIVSMACGGKTVPNSSNTLYENKPIGANAIQTIAGKFQTGPQNVDSIEVIIKGGVILYKCGACGGADTVTGVNCNTTASSNFTVKVQGGMLTYLQQIPALAYGTSPSKPAPYSFMLKTVSQKNLTNSVDKLVLNLDLSGMPAKNQKGCREYLQVMYALKVYYSNGCISLNTYEYNARRP